MKRLTNPETIHAPEIQDLEFTTRIHPKTHTVVMERDKRYRGGPGPEVDSAWDIYDHFKHMAELDQEMIVVVILDVRGRVVGWMSVHRGQQSGVEASAKDILKAAILMNAAYICLLHNHPSGDPSPSEADEDLTKAIETTGGEFGCILLDHIVVGRPNATGESDLPYFSFREDGFLEPLPEEESEESN